MAVETVPATNSCKIPRLTACPLARGKVCATQFHPGSNDPVFVSIMTPIEARALAGDLTRAAEVAEREASHA